MSKIYLEVVESTYISGTSNRNRKKNYVELEVESLDDSYILEVLTNYSESENIILGLEYNNGIVGTNYHALQKYSTAVFIPHDKEEGFFRKLHIEYKFYTGYKINHFISINKVYSKTEGLVDGNTLFVVGHRI